LYHTAAEAHESHAYSFLSRIHEGTYPDVPVVPRDLDRAIGFARASAARNEFLGFVQLARLLSAHPQIRPIDPDELAAAQRQAMAPQFCKDQNNYAQDLQFGRGFRPNPTEAFQWYVIAANHGQPEAMRNLADCYAFGTGTVMDDVLAAQWYVAAAGNGVQRARCNAARALLEGRFIWRDWARAREFLIAAVRDGGTCESEARQVLAQYRL
jgi:TPR repeat protein